MIPASRRARGVARGVGRPAPPSLAAPPAASDAVPAAAAAVALFPLKVGAQPPPPSCVLQAIAIAHSITITTAPVSPPWRSASPNPPTQKEWGVPQRLSAAAA